jgi:hypothetical protein
MIVLKVHLVQVLVFYSQLIFNNALNGFNSNLNMIGDLNIDNLQYEVRRYTTDGMQN